MKNESIKDGWSDGILYPTRKSAELSIKGRDFHHVTGNYYRSGSIGAWIYPIRDRKVVSIEREEGGANNVNKEVPLKGFHVSYAPLGGRLI